MEYQEEKPKSIFREILGWLFYMGVVVIVSYLIITFVGVRTRVSGESMLPTLEDGDNLLVDKLTYRFRAPKRYEIIVFPYKYKEETYYIKRIIGLPGERVQIKEGYVYINGELLPENYGAEVMREAGIAEDEITLGKDEYFVLGDNRNYSSDSRTANVGILKGKDLVGRAWIRISAI